MRNAGTGQATAMFQAKLYLLLLRGTLPTPEDEAKRATKKTSAPSKKAAASARSQPPKGDPEKVGEAKTQDNEHTPRPSPPPNNVGPNLHIDMQIHISADASDTQIDTIFKSMAKHLYGRG